MRRWGSSLLHQLTVSHASVAVFLSLSLGTILMAVVWARARAVEHRLLDTAAALTADQLMGQLRRAEESREGFARALAERPPNGSIEDALWLHSILSYTSMDRVEVFSDFSLLAQAYAGLPGGSPELATQWFPGHPQAAALLQDGKPVTWVQWREKATPSLKTARRVVSGSAGAMYVVVTLALYPSWLGTALPPGVVGTLAAGGREVAAWPPGSQKARRVGFVRPSRLRQDVVRLDDDTTLALELTAPDTFLEQALGPSLRAGAMVALISLVLALLLGQGFARRLLAPLEDLLEGTAAIARGHLSVRLPVRRNDELGALTREFNRMADEIRTTYLGVISTLAEVVEAKSHYTREHIERVERLAMATARVLEDRGWARWSSHQKFILSVAAILHDVGKIAIGNDILNKPGPLSASERTEILSHPDVGGNIVERMGKLDRAAEIIRACHEHFDGSGYPRGLKGDEIPLEARIILAVDAFDAMTQARPYSQARSLEDAIAELRAEAGKQFDPVVVEALIEVVQREAKGERLSSKDSSGFYRSLSEDAGEVPVSAP